MAVTLTPFAGLDNSTVENPEALYLVGGSGTDLDGKLIRAVALVDPTTAQAMVPGSVTFSSLSIADGDDAALGATTDLATASTVIGRLKKLISLVPSALTGGGNLATAVVEALPAGTNTVGGVTVADGDDAAQGTTTDLASASTVVGLLKNLKAALAGTLATATTVADGDDVALGRTTDVAGATSVVGQLKQVVANTTPAPAPILYSHDFVAGGTGATQDGSADPPVAYALQVSGVDAGGAAQAASAWNVSFQQSLDQVNWVTTLTHVSGTNADGAITHATASASVYFRAVVNTVTLGSAHAVRVSFVCKS